MGSEMCIRDSRRRSVWRAAVQNLGTKTSWRERELTLVVLLAATGEACPDISNIRVRPVGIERFIIAPRASFMSQPTGSEGVKQ